jgi:hypothetical protein
MDAGLAAVLGALAGAVATTGAAFATGWASREQARIAARAEHRLQRRDARQAVYEEFIEATNAMVFGIPWMMGRTPNETSNDLSDIPSIAETALSHNAAIRALDTKVQLAGPEPVAKAAGKITTSALILASSLHELKESLTSGNETASEDWWTRAKGHHGRLMEEKAQFTKLARATLDDDGSAMR